MTIRYDITPDEAEYLIRMILDILNNRKNLHID